MSAKRRLETNRPLRMLTILACLHSKNQQLGGAMDARPSVGKGNGQEGTSGRSAFDRFTGLIHTSAGYRNPDNPTWPSHREATSR